MRKITLLLILAFFAFGSNTLVLTQKELEFIKNHPEITFGADTSKVPFAFMDDSGNIAGLDTDFINKINSLSGLNIKQVPGSWGPLLDKLKKREIDGVGVSVYSEDRKDFAIFSKSYATVSKYLFKRKDDNWHIKSMQELKGKKIAIDRYSAADKKIVSGIDGVEFVGTSGMEEATKLLLEGKVDGMIASESFLWYAAKNFISNVEVAYSFDEFRLHLIYSIRSDYPELLSIINKALDAISEQEKTEIASRWLRSDIFKGSFFMPTQEELQWLKSKGEIKLGMEHLKAEHKPYIYMNGNRVSGIAGEYLNLFFESIGKSMVIVRDYPSSDRVAMLKSGNIDFTVLQFPPKEVIGDGVVQSRGHRSFPMAIFAKDDYDFIFSLDELRYKKISACSVYAAKTIRHSYPNADVKACDNPIEGILDIKSGKRDVLIGNLAVVSNYIREMGVDGIKVSAITPLEAKIYLAAHPSMEPLVRMFDRFMDSIPEEKHKEIYERWMSVKLEKSVDYTLLYYIVIGFFAAIALIAFWNATLVREVRQRENAEAALKKSETKFRSIFEHTNIGLVFGDASENILDCNQAFLQLLGYTKEELLQMHFSEFTHKDDLQNEMSLLAELSGGEREFYRLEKRYLRKDGRVVWVDLIVSVIWGDGNSVDFFVGAATDITDRRLLEEELRFLNEQLVDQIEIEVQERLKLEGEKRFHEQLLIQNQKMAEMGEMIGVIAHQWKQPLNVISIQTQMLKDYYDYGDLNREAILEHESAVLQQLKFMSQTVDDFRNFFKPDKEQVKIDLKSEIDAVIRMFSLLFVKDGVNISFETKDECYAMGYSNEFKQVVLNIINNARDAIINSGISGGMISISLFCKDGVSHTYIRDNGGGIPESLLPLKIFENYFSTKGEKGTGIGLAMAKRIIEERMCGKIMARNSGFGAEFEIVLPCY